MSTQSRSLWANLVVILAVALPACQSGPTVGARDSAQRDPRANGIVVVREYEDEFKIDGHDVRVNVEYGWDYDRAVAFERIVDMQGQLMSMTDQPELTLNLTDAEQAYAFDLARAHPDLKKQMLRASHVYGGFSYREADDPACFRGSRCVHVVASAGDQSGDGYRKLVHAIVDLQKGIVVHPHFDDDKTTPFNTTELRAKGNLP